MNEEIFLLDAALADEAARIEATASEGWDSRAIAEEINGAAGRVYGLRCEGVLTGVAIFQLVLDEASLLSITLLPEFRGRGLGRRLLTRALEALETEGAQTCFLEVRSRNAPALALYRSLGFVQAGLRRGFYHAPEDDAIVMKRAACPHEE